MKLYLLGFVLFSSCATQQVDEFSEWEEQSIKKLLIEDRENKELELMFLEEIRQAQKNNDWDAYDFYLEEYMKVPRLPVQDRFKARPDYFIGGERINY